MNITIDADNPTVHGPLTLFSDEPEADPYVTGPLCAARKSARSRCHAGVARRGLKTRSVHESLPVTPPKSPAGRDRASAKPIACPFRVSVDRSRRS